MIGLLACVLFWVGIGTTDTAAQGPWTTPLIVSGIVLAYYAFWRALTRGLPRR